MHQLVIGTLIAVGLAVAGWGISVQLSGNSPFQPWVGPSLWASGLAAIFLGVVWLMVRWIWFVQGRPRLQIIEAVEANMGRWGRGWSLLVQNSSPESAEECHGRLEDIVFESPPQGISLSMWPKHRDLHWSGQLENTYDYKIPGGQTATLNVVYRGYINSKNTVTLAYRGTEDFRYDNRISYTAPVLLLVNITCRGAAPIFAICRIDVASLQNKILESIADRPPFQLLYHGTKRRNIREFQKRTDQSCAPDSRGQ